MFHMERERNWDRAIDGFAEKENCQIQVWLIFAVELYMVPAWIEG